MHERFVKKMPRKKILALSIIEGKLVRQLPFILASPTLLVFYPDHIRNTSLM